MRFGPRIWMALAVSPTLLGLLLLGMHDLAFAQGEGKSQSERVKKEGLRPTGKGNALKGRAVFEDQCAICHFSGSSEKKVGPGLKGIYRYGKFADGKKVDDKSMRAWIESGGKDMPSFKESLKPEQIDDLIAFLRTL